MRREAAGVALSMPRGVGVGGVETWTQWVAERLAGRGLRVTLLEHPHPKEVGGRALPGVERVRVPGPSPGRRVRVRVGDYLPAYRATLPGVLVPNWSVGTYAVCARLAREGAPLRVLGTLHTDEPAYYSLAAYYAPMIAKFLVVSGEIRSRLERLLPERAGDVIELPYHVDVPRVLERPPAPAGGPLRLVYVGRLDEAQKRVSALVPLVERLIAGGADVELRVVGGGSAEGALRGQVEAAGAAVAERVRIEPSLPAEEVGRRVWAEADVLVQLSRYEGASLALREALGWGCVPAVTAVSGVAGLVEHGRNGWVAPVDDPLALAGPLGELARDRGRLAGLSAAARATWEAFPDEGAYLGRLEGLLEEVRRSSAPRWPRGRPVCMWRPGSRLAEWGAAGMALHALREGARRFRVR